MSGRNRKASAHSCAPARLSSIPDDVWKLVRECLKFSDVAALALVNGRLNQLVTGATGFWQGFRQPELDLSQRHHRQLLALYRGKAKVSGLRRVSANNSTAQELLQGLCIELTVRGRNLVGLLRAPAAVRSLRLVDNKRENILPAALAALRAPHALLQLETSFFVNEAKTRAVLAKCQSLQSFSVLSSQSHFGPDDDQEEKVPTSEEKSKTWQKLNGRPFQCLEGLADLRRLEVRYRFMGTFDWLSQLETLPLVEELKLDPVRVWHLEILAWLTNVATKLKKLELVSVTLTFAATFWKWTKKSISPLQHLGISFRGDEDTKCLRDLLRCASLSKVLRRLSIDDCKLTDEDLAGLPAGLHSLALSDCAISEHGLAGLPAHEARCSLPPLSTRVVPTRDPSKLQPSLVWLRAFDCFCLAGAGVLDDRGSNIIFSTLDSTTDKENAGKTAIDCASEDNQTENIKLL
eukprot:g18938.t1